MSITAWAWLAIGLLAWPVFLLAWAVFLLALQLSWRRWAADYERRRRAAVERRRALETPPEPELDRYGNPTDGSRLIYCCFPDCGCDGARNCMAERGASQNSLEINVERRSR